ncbi:MAG: hypothetical protein GX221_10265 [Candidatus Riflebacteria bacterium]|nr:hypothetical protein [Candidatus Riflebacteria bacterium]
MEALSAIIIFFSIISIAVLLRFFPIRLWFTARLSGLKISIVDLIGIRIRGINPKDIVMAAIALYKNGNYVSIDKLEAHALAGGSTMTVAQALIAAQKAGIKLDFNKAVSIDLAGVDAMDAVNYCTKPRNIKTPLITACSKNGKEINVTADITVKGNIDRLIGGADEDTVIARASEEIVAAIASTELHGIISVNFNEVTKIIDISKIAADSCVDILSIKITAH